MVDVGYTSALPLVDTEPTPGLILADVEFEHAQDSVEDEPPMIVTGEAVKLATDGDGTVYVTSNSASFISAEILHGPAPPDQSPVTVTVVDDMPGYTLPREMLDTHGPLASTIGSCHETFVIVALAGTLIERVASKSAEMKYPFGHEP